MWARGTEQGAVCLALARACGPGPQAQAGRGRRASLRQQNRSPGEGAGAVRANRPAPLTELFGLRTRGNRRNFKISLVWVSVVKGVEVLPAFRTLAGSIG